jgi:hypothetical protein
MKTNTNNRLDITELEKAKGPIAVEILEYVANSVLAGTIIKKNTANIIFQRLIKVGNYQKNWSMMRI